MAAEPLPAGRAMRGAQHPRLGSGSIRGFGNAATCLLIIVLAACAPATPQARRLALFAPFEGTYREIGYDMLYPVRLALADAGAHDVVLIAVNAGSTPHEAIVHAAALAADPTILTALVAGHVAADPQVLATFGDVPIVVIGDWNAVPTDRVAVLSSREIGRRLTSGESDVYAAGALQNVVGGETFALKAYSEIAADLTGVTVVSSAAPPSSGFAQRLANSGLFVPAPGLLATAAYDAGLLAAHALSAAATRSAALDVLRGVGTDGLNGVLRFDADGYWSGARVYEYHYRGGELTIADE